MGYSNSDIGHNWAHQLKTRQSGSNFCFSGDKIYSYNTVIGQVVKVNGHTVYLLNTGHYSNSTSKHQGYAFGAIPNDAIKFSISCDDFEYGWSGYGVWSGEFTKENQVGLVKKYIHKMYEQVVNFSESRSLADEKEFSLHWYNEAKRLCELTKCTTVKQLYKTWLASSIELRFNIKDGSKLKRMLKAMNAGVTSLNQLVDITCGNGTYEKYVNRTKGPRAAAETRKINRLLGFKVQGGYHSLVRLGLSEFRIGHKTTKKRYPTFIERCYKCTVEGGWSSRQIDRYRKQGILVQEMLKVRRENLLKNLEAAELSERNAAIQKAKRRLELHLGLNGWGMSYPYDKRRITSFNYNGTVYDQFGYYNNQRQLTWDEYFQFTKMTREQQQTFIFEKRQWMLEMLQDELARYRGMQERLEADIREREELARIREQKQDYINEKKAEGDSGLVQLFHEGLIDGGFYNKSASFFHGGNALLRVNERKQIVQTSKGIEISFAECKRLWVIVKRWHDNKVTFTQSEETVNATTHNWQINRYQDDIMIAGCHAIHFSEMEYAAKQIGLIA